MRIAGVTSSSTVGVHQHAIGRAAGDQPRALGDGVAHQAEHALGRVEADQRAERRAALARIAGDERRRFGGELGGEFVGDGFVDDQPLGRHADLALVHEGAESRGGDRFVEVGVVEHDQRRLAAEFEQRRLEMARRQLGDLPPDAGRAGEVDPPHRRVGDQRLDDARSVGGRVADDIDDAFAEPRLAAGFADQAMDVRTDFRALEHDGVAAGERRGDRPHAEDHRRVPRRDAEHDADRLAQRERA